MDLHTVITAIINLTLFILIIFVIIKINNPDSMCYNKYQELLSLEASSIVYAGFTTIIYWDFGYQLLMIIDLFSFIGYALLFAITCIMFSKTR